MGVYELIPTFRDRCPLCGGAGCAVRHGLYFRTVVDGSGVHYQLGVPRFLCRRRGPLHRRGSDVTFSVLPPALLPRRRFSLGLLRWLVEQVVGVARSVPAALDAFAALPEAPVDELAVDPAAVYRALHLFAGAYLRLVAFPVYDVESERVSGLRRRSAVVAAALVSTEQRGPPLALRFHRQYFPHLPFDLPVLRGTDAQTPLGRRSTPGHR